MRVVFSKYWKRWTDVEGSIWSQLLYICDLHEYFSGCLVINCHCWYCSQYTRCCKEFSTANATTVLSFLNTYKIYPWTTKLKTYGRWKAKSSLAVKFQKPFVSQKAAYHTRSTTEKRTAKISIIWQNHFCCTSHFWETLVVAYIYDSHFWL